MAKILGFPRLAASAPPLAQFVRIGLAYRKLGDLLAEGRLPAKRVVFEASRVRHQKTLIDSFRLSGAETVLDPQTAELAARPNSKAGCGMRLGRQIVSINLWDRCTSPEAPCRT